MHHHAICGILPCRKVIGKSAVSSSDITGPLAGVAHGLDALREGGVAPKLLIIDDGWQSTQLDEPLRPITETGIVKSENKVGPCLNRCMPRRAPAVLRMQYEGGCWTCGAGLSSFTFLLQVLMAASKRTAVSGGSPMAQLANQAAVLENGAGDSGKAEVPAQVGTEQGTAWERFKGFLAGLVAALITTLYTVSPDLGSSCS